MQSFAVRERNEAGKVVVQTQLRNLICVMEVQGKACGESGYRKIGRFHAHLRIGDKQSFL